MFIALMGLEKKKPFPQVDNKVVKNDMTHGFHVIVVS
jgi:hypothetical protein